MTYLRRRIVDVVAARAEHEGQTNVPLNASRVQVRKLAARYLTSAPLRSAHHLVALV